MSIEHQLQSLLDQMQADSDRMLATVSGMGDVVIRYQNNQKALFSELGRLLNHQAQPPYPQQPLYPAPNSMQGPPTGYSERGVPYYAPQEPQYPDQQYDAPRAAQVRAQAHAPHPGALANGYDQSYYQSQGYPPQPYQERHSEPAPPEGQISQVLKNLRRQQG